MKLLIPVLLLGSSGAFAQHDHTTVPTTNHLNHIQVCRKGTVYIHNLPRQKILTGIGRSDLKIETKSDSAQLYFSQGVALLHCFWDLEAYRAFKEAIRCDSTAIMPYWGLATSSKGDDFKADREVAIKRLKKLRPFANEHERLYAESEIVSDSLKENGQKEVLKKLELIVHKYPDDTDAQLFLALGNMSGYDSDSNPNEGQLFAELLVTQLLKKYPDNAAAHHYWIHLMENCCPDKALESAEKLSLLTPASGHMVHMPGHIFYRVGEYQKAYDAFLASMKVDSIYMQNQQIQEVDNWNYIHNLHYLLANCSQDGRYQTALKLAEKVKALSIDKSRKSVYNKSFFSQGILAPARMEWCFGFYDRAAVRLSQISDPDTLYGGKSMDYKEAMTLFFRGMDAVVKNNTDLARNLSNELDAFLYRNEKQSNLPMGTFLLNNLAICSLELQGRVKGLENRYDEAMSLLAKANKKEVALGYSEPSYYSRPVLFSIAALQLQNRKYDDAVASWDQLSARFPNNLNSVYGKYSVYKKKGDKAKINEYREKVNRAVGAGDKSLYPL